MDKKQQEIEKLKQLSPYSLPDNPSQSGWSLGQIKEKFYTGLFYLLNTIQELRDNSELLSGELRQELTKAEGTLNDILNGNTVVPNALKDSEGNIINEAYAKIAELNNGAVGVLKYIKTDGSTEQISQIETRVMSVIRGIQSYFVDGAVAKAVADKDGNPIHAFYETKNDAYAKHLEIRNDFFNDLENLKKDNEKTYTKKADITDNLTSTSTEKPLSANQGRVLKGLIDVIQNILSSDDVNLDTVREIVDYIKSNKNVIDTLSTSKVSFTDIIDNLESAITNKPLSANQGKVLKEIIASVKEEIEEKISKFVFADIDEELNADSENPVANRVITMALDEKANKDGYYALMHTGLADNLASPDGITDTEPYIFRTTAGTQSVSDGYAENKEIRGKTLTLNQLYLARNNVSASGVQITNNGDETLTFNGTATGENYLDITEPNYRIDFVQGHKYFLSGGVTNLRISAGSASITGQWSEGNAIIFTANTTTSNYIRCHIVNGTTYDNVVIRPRLIDLTKMGIEHITTVAEFNALTRGLDVDTYNKGTPIHSNLTGIKSTGFNAFDGEWTVGDVNSQTGAELADNRFIKTNYIPVVGGQEYELYQFDFTFLSSAQRKIVQFDKNKNVIKTFVDFNASNRLATSRILKLEDNCCYVRIVYYNSDAKMPLDLKCVFHLTHSGYRNGQYEPHWSEERHIDTTKYFPEGMKSAGNAYDSLTPKKARKVVGSVDLGSLNWIYNETYGYITTTNTGVIPAKKAENNVIPNLLCSLYTGDTYWLITGNNPQNKTINVNKDGRITVYDNSYTNAETFKQAMSGVILYYELAEPEETEIIETRSEDWFYRISDFGTEEQLVVDGFAPAVIETFYMNNLRDKLRNLPEIPKCEDTTGTSVLKCINGTMVWVKEE